VRSKRLTPRPNPQPSSPRPPARSRASGRPCGRAGTQAPGAAVAQGLPDHPSGRQLFVELLADQGSAEDARSFGLRLAFARYLAPGARLALLERRRAQLVQRLDEIAHAKNDNELDVYARSVVEHTTESVAQDIAWLDRLLATERSDGQASTQERSTVAVRQGLEPRRAVQTEH